LKNQENGLCSLVSDRRMKKLDAFRWLCAATLGALMLLTAQSAVGHGTGGGHGTSGGPGTGGGPGAGSGHGTGTGHAAATGHAKGGHQAFLTHRSSQETGDMRSIHGDRFFHQRLRFSTGFVGFRFPYLWSDYGPVYDYRFWQDLAMKVQSELARLGYYRGAANVNHRRPISLNADWHSIADSSLANLGISAGRFNGVAFVSKVSR
jgi:hypothetical protein